MPASAPVSHVAIEYVSPDLLDFDPENPRFATKMIGNTQEQIQKQIFGEPYYAVELVDSFLQNGFIDFEPLVVKRGSKNRLVVIEGNRRLAAIKEIRSNPAKYSSSDHLEDLESIPVLVFHNKPTAKEEDALRVYLGVRHLFGFRDWPPLSKAQYLEEESKRPGGIDRILRETQLSKTTAKGFLIPLRVLKQAKEQIPAGDDFANLSEALKRSGTAAFLELETDPKTLEVISFDKKKFALLLDDLYGKKEKGARNSDTKVVSDTREISTYARVLSSKVASAVLHSGKSLADAEIYVDTTEESKKRLIKLNKQIGTLLKKMSSGSKKTKEDTNALDAYKAFDAEIKKYIANK